MSREHFTTLFRQNLDGSFEPIKRIRINHVELGPGVRFRPGILFGGIDLTLFAGRDFEIVESEGVSEVTAIYQ